MIRGLTRLLHIIVTVLALVVLSTASTAATPPFPVILIHGWDGGPDKTWATLSTNLVKIHLWTEDGGTVTASSTNVRAAHFYEMQFSDNDNTTLTFDQQAIELSKAIKAVLDANHATKVILVGHSMGGLAARQYLEFRYHYVVATDNVAALITIGTPHQGGDVVLLAVASGVSCSVVPVNCLVLEDLKPDSTALGLINNRVAVAKLPRGISYTSLIGNRLLVSGDGIVTAESQNLANIPGTEDLRHTAVEVTIFPCTTIIILQVHTCETQDSRVEAQIVSAIDSLAQGIIVFADNVESGPSGWFAESPWGITSATSHSATHSWTDSPSGNYANNANTSLFSPILNFSSLNSATLTFWHRYDLQNGFDFGSVWVTTDNGVTFTQVASFTGTNTTWTQATIDLDAFAGEPSVRIVFQLTSDSSIARDGWYIDDVIVREGRDTVSTNVTSGWNLFSVPLDPIDPSPFAVLCDDLSPCYSVYGWNPDPLVSNYVENPDIRPGQSYWVYVESNTSVDAQGALLGGSNHVQALGTGWHMVGQPFNFAVRLSDLNVRNPAEGWLSLREAARLNYVNPWIYFLYNVAGTIGYYAVNVIDNRVFLTVWNPETQQWGPWEPQPSTGNLVTVNPWSGFWIYSRSSNNLLEIPALPTTPFALQPLSSTDGILQSSLETQGNSARRGHALTANDGPPPPPPPPPSDTTVIDSGPANPTNLTSATFAFSSTAAGATFECSLDGATFKACTSPKRYTRLPAGNHNFQVRATATGETDPTPASFDWIIDNTRPITTISSHPPTVTTDTSASFQFTSTEPGSTFQCKLNTSAFASCTSPQGYNGLAIGKHTFQVRATDAAGNADKTPAKFNWTIDTTPPETSITGKPKTPTASTSATVKFKSSERNSIFQCSLDSAGFTPCTSPKNYSGLAVGNHNFQVRATDPAGNIDPTPASLDWMIQ